MGKRKMRVLVCGGRYFSDTRLIWDTLDKLALDHGFTHLIHGAARGVDSIAANWALTRPNITSMAFPADWDHWGLAAGPIRNQQMLTEGKPDLIIAFPGGKGTADMIRRAMAAKVKVEKISG
jgi:hypothetical protein